jgi:crotonobetainyl-CoA:carnitine CoA-transferase CaiB-like acyl-CoA transferase
VRLLGTPVKLSRTPAHPERAGGPPLGGDTDAVLAEAGYTAEQVTALKASGAVAGPADVAEGSFLA